MAKLIWINGAFGAGKTSAAEELHARIADSFLYDPEETGFLIRKCLPKSLHKSDFREHPEWRRINNLLLRRIVADYHGTVIIPMTVTDPRYFRELTEGTAVDCHVVLYTSRETLLARLKERGEGEDSFGAQMADRCLRAFDEIFPRELPDANLLPVDTLTVRETADEIEKLL